MALIFVLQLAAFIPGGYTSCGGGSSRPWMSRPWTSGGEAPLPMLTILVPQKDTDNHCYTVIGVVWQSALDAVNYKLEIKEPTGLMQRLDTKDTSYRYYFHELGLHMIRVTAKRKGKKIGRTNWLNFIIRGRNERLTNEMKTASELGLSSVDEPSKVIFSIPYEAMVDDKKLPSVFFKADLTKPALSPLAIYSPQPGSDMHPGLLAILWEKLKQQQYTLQVVDVDTYATLFYQTLSANQLILQIDTPGTYRIKVAETFPGTSSLREQSTVTFRVVPHGKTLEKPLDKLVTQKVQRINQFLSDPPPILINELPREFSIPDPRKAPGVKSDIYAPQQGSEMLPGPLTILWEHSKYPLWNLKVAGLDSLSLLFEGLFLSDNRRTIVVADPGRYLIEVYSVSPDGARGELSMVAFSVLSIGQPMRTPVNTYIRPRPRPVPLLSARPLLKTSVLPTAFSVGSSNKPVWVGPTIYAPQEGSQMYADPLTILWDRFPSSNLKIIDAYSRSILFDQTLSVNRMTVVLEVGDYVIRVSRVFANGNLGNPAAVTFHVVPSREPLRQPVTTYLHAKKKSSKKIDEIHSTGLSFSQALPHEFFQFNSRKSRLSKITVYSPQQLSEMRPGRLTILWEHTGSSQTKLKIIDADDTISVLAARTKTSNRATFQFHTPGNYLIKVAKVHEGEAGEWTLVVFRVVPVGRDMARPMVTYI